VGLHEHAGVGGVLDGVEDAPEIRRRRVERVTDELGVFKTLVKIGVLEVIHQLVVDALVGQGREERREDQGPETKGHEEPKAQAPLTHYMTSL